jgi:hypothetical protein
MGPDPAPLNLYQLAQLLFDNNQSRQIITTTGTFHCRNRIQNR